MMLMPPVWRVVARVSGGEAAAAVFTGLDEIAPAVSAFEAANEEWRLEAYRQEPLLTPELRARLALAAAAAGGEVVEIDEEKLGARDWVAENQLAFPPLRVGRFFIHGSHHRGGVPAGAVAIAVDAATAFGTGEHPSTRACLLALDRLARRRRFRTPLDIGTGTGILSIAAAKLLRRKILASDIDPGAVAVARHNAARNGVASLVRVRSAVGYRDRAVRKSRHDLILSNILARPLALLAPELARSLAPGGRAVLSGLLRRQEPIVLWPHRACGIVLDHRLVIDGWSTVILRQRASRIWRWGPQPPSLNSVAAAMRSGLAPAGEFSAVRERYRRRGRLRPAANIVKGGDLRAVQPDIGERMVVERQQLDIGPLAPPPFGKRPSRRNEKVDHGHGKYSGARSMLRRTRNGAALQNRQLLRRNPAM
jgi:ribosomal protein L11 methyltransferase